MFEDIPNDIVYYSAGRSMFWKLDENHIPVPCGRRDFYLMFDGDKAADRIVKQETINGARVSTILLALAPSDGSFFETMIFDHPTLDCWQRRYNTWDEAVAGHNAAVELVKASTTPGAPGTPDSTEPNNPPKQKT